MKDQSTALAKEALKARDGFAFSESLFRFALKVDLVDQACIRETSMRFFDMITQYDLGDSSHFGILWVWAGSLDPTFLDLPSTYVIVVDREGSCPTTRSDALALLGLE